MKSELKIIYCRVYQIFQKIVNYFLGFHTPEYIKGFGSLDKLTDLIKKENINNILVVTGKRILASGIIDSFLKELNDENILYTLFSDIHPNPTDVDVENGYKAFIDNEAKGVVVIGGGGPMDLAKAICAKNARPNKTIEELIGNLKIRKKIVPFFAVPTTSGTGSETTIASVIVIEKTHHKASINDPSILPKYVVLDPKLTVSLPKDITAQTGMDALCHAIESYTNYTYTTHVERDLAKKATKLIYENLFKAYEDGDNLIARENMQLAAFLAGRSFTRGCVGYVHAIGHTLSGLYGLGHGLTMATILPIVLREYGESVYERLSELAGACGFVGSNKEKALSFIEWIEELNKKMNIPNHFEMIKDEDIPQIIKWADKEANPLYPVPKIWCYNDFERLINILRNK